MTHARYIGAMVGLAVAFVVVCEYAQSLRDARLEAAIDNARAVERCGGVLVVVRSSHGESWACASAPGQRRY